MGQMHKNKYRMMILLGSLGVVCVIIIISLWRDKLEQESTERHHPENVVNETGLEGERPSKPNRADSSVSTAPSTTEETKSIIGESSLGTKEQSIPDLMDMTWDTWSIEVDFSDKQLLKENIARIPVKQNSNISEEDVSKLHDALCDILYYFGNNDFEAYHNYLKAAGETLSPELLEAFKETLVTYHQLAEDEVSPEPWARFMQYSSKNMENSLWRGLVVKHSNIEVFKTSNEKLKPPGDMLGRTRGSITSYGHLSTPPITFSEMLKRNGHVFVADITLFIQHTDEAGQKVRPYVIRMWHDSVNKIWRPLQMTFFPNAYESLYPKLSF